MNEEITPTAATFDTLGISPAILRMLHARKLTAPTPIQHQAIPPGIQGKDLIGIAQTGTGKTFAFGIPLLQRLNEHGGRALIVLPTRELAFQVEESLAPIARELGIGTAVFVGGASMHLQRQMLRRNPRVLVATPGRLNDHLEQGTVTLKEVKILVLDEADRMLDMGFLPQIERILRHVPKERQTLLFSATMPQDIVRLANEHMKLPLRIEVAPPGTTVAAIEQEIFVVRKEDKQTLLQTLLKEYSGPILVFSRTKHGAKKITSALRLAGITAAEIHANRSLAQRREALEGFKSGRFRVLVATDIAARGIHVTGIEVVINFDLPDDPADYVHRIGRTGRAGREGRAISFASPDQSGSLRDIERLTRGVLKRSSHGSLPAISMSSGPSSGSGRPQQRFHRGPRPGGNRPSQRGGRSGGGFRGGRRS